MTSDTCLLGDIFEFQVSLVQVQGIALLVGNKSRILASLPSTTLLMKSIPDSDDRTMLNSLLSFRLQATTIKNRIKKQKR